MDLIAPIVKFNSQTVGRDKLCRTVQYTTKLLGYLLQKHGATVDTLKLIRAVEVHVSTSRKLFRIGKYLDMLQGAFRSLSVKDTALRLLVVSVRLTRVLYFLVDQIVWATRLGIYKSDPKAWSKFQAKIWSVALILCVTRNMYDIHNLFKAADKKNEEPGSETICWYEKFKTRPEKEMAFLPRCALLRAIKQVNACRFFATTRQACKEMNYPIHANTLGRWAGIASMMRLPVHENAKDLDACFVGIPFDSGTSYRSGTRFGPRQIRTESTMIRHVNAVTGASPYESMMVADIGDMSVVPFNVERTCRIIKEETAKIIKDGCRPLFMGGDHLVSYPVLQAMKEKYGKIGVVHIDSHADTIEHQLDERLAHGTPFTRAVEEDLLDSKRVVQIGLRGSLYSHDDFNVAESEGFRVVRIEECWHKSLTPLMEEVREQMGDGPVYLTFCIDAIDPAFAPGTGTPEVGGLTTIQAIEIVRGCKGLNVIGADVVEVSPPYDPFGTTALIAANLLFEMLCILPGVHYVK